MKLHRHFAVLIGAVFIYLGGVTGAEELSLNRAVSMVLETSDNLTIARESSNAAYQGYKIVRSQGYPQVSLSTDPLYGFGIRRDYLFEDFPIIERTGVTHSINAGIEFSQLLPTGGSTSINLSDTFDYRVLLEEETEEGTLDSSYQLAQRPQLSLQFSQPIFVGGRFLDGKLMDASRRIAEIDWEKGKENERLLRTQELLSTVDLYLRLLLIERNLQFLEARLSLAQQQVDQANIDEKQGRISSNQVLGLEVAVNKQRESILDARILQVQADRDLARKLGMRDLKEYDLIDNITDLLEKTDATMEKIQTLDMVSPEIATKRLQLEQAAWQARVNNSDNTPLLGLALNLAPRYPDDRETPENLGSAFTDFFTEDSGLDVTFGVNVRVPLSDGGKREAQEEADNVAQLIARLDLTLTEETYRDQADLAIEREQLLNDRLLLLETNRDYQKNRLDREQNLAASRTVTDLSVELIRLEYTATEDTLWQTKADLLYNRLELFALTGYPIEDLFLK